MGLAVAVARKHIDRAGQLHRIRRGDYSAAPYPPLDPEIEAIYRQLDADRADERRRREMEADRRYGRAMAVLAVITLLAVAVAAYLLMRDMR